MSLLRAILMLFLILSSSSWAEVLLDVELVSFQADWLQRDLAGCQQESDECMVAFLYCLRPHGSPVNLPCEFRENLPVVSLEAASNVTFDRIETYSSVEFPFLTSGQVQFYMEAHLVLPTLGVQFSTETFSVDIEVEFNSSEVREVDQVGVPVVPPPGVLKALFNAHCPENFFGSNCSVECVARNDSLGHFTCNSQGKKLCLLGYCGSNCSVECNECEAVTCRNGGTCRDLFNDFQCLCEAGFTGETCETQLMTSPTTRTTTTAQQQAEEKESPSADSSFSLTQNTVFTLAGIGGFVFFCFVVFTGIVVCTVVKYCRLRKKYNEDNQVVMVDTSLGAGSSIIKAFAVVDENIAYNDNSNNRDSYVSIHNREEHTYEDPDDLKSSHTILPTNCNSSIETIV